MEYECRHQCPADPSLFRALDERARIPDKRPLIDLIDSLIAYTRHHQQMVMANSEVRHLPHPATHTTTHPNITSAPHLAVVPKSPSMGGIPSVHQPSEFSVAPTMTLPDVSPLLASLSSLPIFNMKSPNISSSTDAHLTVRPTYEDIIRRRPNSHVALYEALPRQCTNCGLRFPDTPEGQTKLHAHLDAHFRRNIRLKDKGKKVMARIWLPPEQDWIRIADAGDTERPGKDHEMHRERGNLAILIDVHIVTLFSGPNAPTAPTTLASEDLSERKIPMIPAGSDHASKTCRLCQEPISIIWDDEADEWMYKDAIYQDAGDDNSKEVRWRDGCKNILVN